MEPPYTFVAPYEKEEETATVRVECLLITDIVIIDNSWSFY